MPDQKNNILIFFHLPKTGGTTLNGILFKNMSRYNSWYFSFWNDDAEIKNMLKAVKSRNITSITGHMAFGLHSYLTDYPYKYVTLLREPISRVQSYFQHFKRLPPERKLDFIGIEKSFDVMKSAEWSLTDFLHKKISNQMDNAYTRYFAAERGVPITFMDKKTLTVDDLDRAKNNLLQYVDVIGITEEYNKSLLLLQAHLGIKDIFYVKRNMAKKAEKITVSEAALTAVCEYNQFDIELYQFAKDLMLERFEKSNLSIKLSEYEQQLKEYQDDYKNIAGSRIPEINNLIHSIEKSKNVAVYSCGEHTQKLFKLTDIAQADIKCILDTYKDNETCEGYDVLKADKSSISNIDVIVISNFPFQNHIIKLLRDKLGYTGEIISFYNEADVLPFYEV